MSGIEQSRETELNRMNREIPIGPLDFPNDVYLEFKEANSKYPQALIGICVKTLAKLLDTPTIKITEADTYKFNDGQYQDLFEKMERDHPKVGVTRPVSKDEMVSSARQFDDFLRAFVAFIKRDDNVERNIERAKLFFGTVSQMFDDDEVVKRYSSERWPKLKEMPPQQRFRFSTEVMFYLRGTPLFNEFLDEYLFLKKQVA